MIRGFKAPLLALTVAIVVAGATSAVAQTQLGSHARPGSALFFPVYDTGENDRSTETIITVTNTNSSTIACPNNNVQGDVFVHFVYFDGEECEEENLGELLTPGDTITLLTSRHNSNGTQGWLWVEAWDPELMEAIDYDFLIGSAIIVKSNNASDTDFLFSYTPYTFRGLVSSCTAPGSQSRCGYCLTDENSNNAADFNGNEYECFPGTLYLDMFFAEGQTWPVGSGDTTGNQLYLMIPEGIGGNDTFRLSLRIWDNSEDPSSRTLSTNCWFNGSLSDLSGRVLADNIGGDPEELPGLLTGWMRLRAEDRSDNSTYGMLGVYAHQLLDGGGGVTSAAGHELHFEGKADNDVSIGRF